MSHQPGNSYLPLPSQSHGGDTDPNETRRLLGQQNLSPSNGHLSPQSHGGDTDPNEIRRQLGQHVPVQSNTQPSTGQQSSSQYTTQVSSTVQYSTGSSPNISRTSSQATQQQAYQSTNQPHRPVQYRAPQTGQPQPQYFPSAGTALQQHTNLISQQAAHYVPVSSLGIQRKGKELIQTSGYCQWDPASI